MPRHPRRFSPLRLDRFLPYELSVLAAMTSRRLADEYESRFGLQMAEWRVMAVLGYFHPMSSNGIVVHTSMDKAKVSRAVGRLIRRGLLTRRSHPSDRRLLVLEFSPRGRRLYAEVTEVARAWEAWFVGAITPSERRRLHRMLAALSRRLDGERRGGAGSLTRRHRRPRRR